MDRKRSVWTIVKWTGAVLGLGAVALVIGCVYSWRQLTTAEVAGRYIALWTRQSSTLVLRPDGTLSQEVNVTPGNFRHIDGKWRLTGRRTDLIYQQIEMGPIVDIQNGTSYQVAVYPIWRHSWLGSAIDISVGVDFSPMYQKVSE